VATPNNPYTPPQAPLRESAGPVTGPGWKALLLGVVTDIGGTLAVSVVLSVIAALVMGDSAADPETFRSNLNSGIWPMLGMVFGSLCTVAGGYVAARVANHAEYRYAAACGLIALVLSELMVGGGDAQADFGMRIAGWIATVPLAMLGARFRLREKAVSQSAQRNVPDP
jgi:hypothetical protein